MKQPHHRHPPSAPPGDAFRRQSLGGSRPIAAEMNWLWRGYLAPGQLTLLTSLWKSGKTTLLSLLLSRLKEDGELLGLPVRPARALVLSEESTDLWQRRRQRLVFGAHTDLISRPFAGKPSDADWRALIDHAGNVLGTEGGRLLVIDTVATLMPSGVETNADCMVRALAPLRRLAEQGIAVWLMHHPHKGKSRAGQWARGTGSLPASVDIVVEMHAFRPDDPDDRRRWLLGHSRHEETPRRLLIEWTADGADYRVLTDPPDEDFERGWSAIRRVLSAGEAPQTAAEILRAWPATSAPPSRATLPRWLARAVQRQLVCCEATQRRNAPYRYWLVAGEEG
jgi:AAA domain